MCLCTHAYLLSFFSLGAYTAYTAYTTHTKLLRVRCIETDGMDTGYDGINRPYSIIVAFVVYKHAGTHTHTLTLRLRTTTSGVGTPEGESDLERHTDGLL